MVSKVIFIGDTQRGEQAGNILRLQALFSPVLKELDVPFSTHVTATNRLEGDAQWLSAWQASLADDQESTLDADVFRDAAAIGFEVAEKDLARLSQHGVPWMNISIHPLRFLDDLYLDITTSFPYDFSRHAASRGLIDVCVQALKVRYGLAQEQHDPAALTIFGQSPFDRSVYFDGGFRCLTDYLGKLDDLVAGYDRVLYKPHPYVSDPGMDALITSRYGAQPCSQRDIYELFVRGNIGAACAVSSSVLAEAPCFGIKAEYLEPRAKRFGPPIGYRALLDDPVLWKGLLGQPLEAERALHISRAVPEGYLRRVYSSWGFVTDDELLKRGIEEELARKLEHDHDFAEKCERTLEKNTRNLAQVKALADRAMAQADQYSRELHDVSSQLDAVYASASWRFTSPARWLANQVRLLQRLGVRARAKTLLKKCARKSIDFLNHRPSLRNRVIAAGKAAGLGGVMKKVYWKAQGAPGSAVQFHGAGRQYEQLSPHGKEIYRDLDAAIGNANLKGD